MINLYTLDGKFIEKSQGYKLPENFTGIAESFSGTKFWFQDGYYHRLNGPAIIWSVGTKEWYVHGEETTELQCKLLYDIMKLKGLL